MLNFKHLHYFLAIAKSGGINRAAERLHLTPQTLSGQLAQFEERLGVPLFRRGGRRMELTETGKLALSYAEEIFQVSTELEELLRGGTDERVIPFRVGIADVVPKSIAHQLLAPVLALADPIRLICREDRLERLLADMAIHRLDMVLADRPMPPGMDVKGYSHPLGECGVTFFATPDIATRLGADFPRCLDGAPLLIPGEDSALRAPLLRWLERQGLHPRVVGEFDDPALMKAFGQSGAGVFPAPTATAPEVEAHYGVAILGQTDDLRERFFAISAERRLTHPAVVAVSEIARTGVFKGDRGSRQAGGLPERL
ncbi:MAG: transcriptional activator NhaR [Thiobacillus sp.]|nr:MAG: LysR family transcriptional regulator [Thiobacillus sp. SCN 63-374]OZA26819.1 MAG: transcriptional activator NhaR [Hydrogenophilales bacterium 17-64-11]